MSIHCDFSDQQLQKKFKHASDFGITGNYNLTNAEQFKQVLLRHLHDSNTQAIQGTYRGEPVTHFFNPITKLNVMCKNNKFLSGWVLAVEQEQYLLTTGNVI